MDVLAFAAPCESCARSIPVPLEGLHQRWRGREEAVAFEPSPVRESYDQGLPHEDLLDGNWTAALEVNKVSASTLCRSARLAGVWILPCAVRSSDPPMLVISASLDQASAHHRVVNALCVVLYDPQAIRRALSLYLEPSLFR